MERRAPLYTVTLYLGYQSMVTDNQDFNQDFNLAQAFHN